MTLIKKNILLLIAFLFISCSRYPQISEDFYEISSEGLSYWVDKDLNDYSREYIEKKLSADLESFYRQFADEPISSGIPIVIFTLGSWNVIGESRSLTEIIKKIPIDNFYGNISLRKILETMQNKSDSISAVYVAPVNTIIVRLNSKYDSKERILNLLISEYNHGMLEKAGQQLTDREFVYWLLLIDEGLTHFYKMYIQECSYTLNQKEVGQFIEYFKLLKFENKIEIDQNVIESSISGAAVTTKTEQYLSISFIVYLMDEFGLDLFYEFINLLYFSEYSSLDDLFSNSYNRTFREIYLDWMDYMIKGKQ